MTRYQDMLKAVQTVVQAATAPIQQTLAQMSPKVDDLTADRVRRSDLDDMRREMQAGFSAMETKFVPRDLGEQRYKDLVSDIAAHTSGLETLSKKIDLLEERRQDRGMTLGNQVVTWVLMSVAIGISIIAILVAAHA